MSHSHRRILIVDDEKDLCYLFKMVLEDHDFIVDIYDNPAQALAEFKPNTFDLLVLDIKMPGMNGFELYKEIKNLDKKVKVLFITAFVVDYNLMKDIFEVEEIPNFPILSKPIDPDTLADKIKESIGTTL